MPALVDGRGLIKPAIEEQIGSSSREFPSGLLPNGRGTNREAHEGPRAGKRKRID
ncbi:hypothetical protein GGTG_02536 [Gaeumannomyces tritici R3-111a-1]|uniref:Uncharacterized protein n=1 Tax=Gaeumannomyces tritici (strain R3-111a-1) TaxID=644352 RepID=J3NMN0_GAET3|nr:hypothetical protein GGTG_02536 [Gaeumannomyces tritici R3-111a-1]EJT82563.1 hypothetical protein GGTG_02536 [Gaeumannomyces tritici R3-111a-1]